MDRARIVRSGAFIGAGPAGGALVGGLLALAPIALHRAGARAGRRKLQAALAAWGRGGR